jgi:hypothetical protein
MQNVNQELNRAFEANSIFSDDLQKISLHSIADDSRDLGPVDQ